MLSMKGLNKKNSVMIINKYSITYELAIFLYLEESLGYRKIGHACHMLSNL